MSDCFHPLWMCQSEVPSLEMLLVILQKQEMRPRGNVQTTPFRGREARLVAVLSSTTTARASTLSSTRTFHGAALQFPASHQPPLPVVRRVETDVPFFGRRAHMHKRALRARAQTGGSWHLSYRAKYWKRASAPGSPYRELGHWNEVGSLSRILI